ncbi:MAG: hypothetical protein ACK493_11950 [Planctomycetota bacterium]|jgi:hypothetical protein|nr:hypothetical protein [Blastopirellula sp.]
MHWNKDYFDMLNVFNEENVEYLIVGAYAMAVSGCPRSTGHIDLWIRPSAANADRVWLALKRFRAPLAKMSARDFELPDLVYQMGVAPQRIDLLTSVSGVEFDEAWQNRKQVEVSGLSVPVLGLSELIANKLATGRAKDLLDVELLRNR